MHAIVNSSRSSAAGPVQPSSALRSCGRASDAHAHRDGGLLMAIARAILCVVLTTLVPTPATADPLTPATAIYGVATDNNIYALDPLTGQVTGTTSTASLSLTGSTANAFALDRDKSQIFFVSSDKNLYFWDRPSDTLGQVATAAQLGLSGTTPIPRNATFFDGKFWFIGSGDNKLRGAAITYTSGLPSGITLESPVDISGVTGTLDPNDIAYDPLNTTIYGSNLNLDFFSINVSNLAAPVPFTSLYTSPIGVQLAFDQDYSTLYGLAFATGQWYTVGRSGGGAFTEISGAVTSAEFRMADLAGGLTPVPEPGSMTLAACGICGAAGLFLRGRRRR